MQPISEEALENVTGQNGVSLSGELSFNEDGGPLTSSDPENINAVWGNLYRKRSRYCRSVWCKIIC